MSHQLPEVNTLVRVCVGDEPDGHASRVENVTDESLELAAPSFAGDLFTTHVGMPVSVHWTGARGIFEIDGELDDVRREYSVLLWSVRALSPVRLLQRRRYARARCDVPMSFVRQGAGPSAVVTGVGVDLSEGGLRARVAAGALENGAYVEVRFALDDIPVTAVGTVLKAIAVERLTEVVMVFEDPVADDAVIRRWVLRQQILARRMEAS